MLKWIALCLIFFSPITFAKDFYTEKDIAQLIEFIKVDFWGKAALPNGKFIRPINEQERHSLLIPFDEAARVVKAAVPSGYGVFCQLDDDWKKYFVKFMARERERKIWTDRQVAFLLYLFNASRDQVSNHLKKEKTQCDGEMKSQALTLLTQARLSILLKSQT